MTDRDRPSEKVINDWIHELTTRRTTTTEAKIICTFFSRRTKSRWMCSHETMVRLTYLATLK